MSQTHTFSNSRCIPTPRRQNGLLSLIALWRSRQQLAKLDATQLCDIGISARDAAKEATRTPWDVPAHWRN
jgi:uncharacterized protein YjiS (DUF1127 family)